MLHSEALWIRNALSRLDPADIRSVLNVGSSTREFRTRTQPHIDSHVFSPLRQRGCEVVHLDIKAADGVDLVGDLKRPAFREEVRARSFRLVVCSNLLEHVESPEREELCHTLGDVVAPGGYLLYTVPRSFPYHFDPIDTMYRPSIEDLSHLHPTFSIAASALVSHPGTARRDLALRAFRVLRSGAYGIVPRLFRQSSIDAARHRASLPHCFRKYTVSCVLLQKPSATF